MISGKNIRIASAITILGIMGIAGHLSARENVVSTHHKNGLKTTATGCTPAASSIDLDINNVRARLMTGGDMWWNIGEGIAAYEVPKGSGRSSQFAASCWIGGYDKQHQLKVAAQTYRQDGNDYWPGALDPATGKIDQQGCVSWDRFWKIDRATINQFVQLYKSTGSAPSGSDYDAIYQWPAAGNKAVHGNANAKGVIGGDGSVITLKSGYSYAPFIDLNGNGRYEPTLGDYPNITGDEYIWWVFNDAGNVKQQSLTAAMGVEVQTSAFAYATQDFLNNSTFCQYRVINRGALTIDSTYIAVWDDCDLGYYYDDFIGCDTTRGLGIQYNGTNDDGGAAGHPVNSYGLNPPQVGLDFFQGPTRSVLVHRIPPLLDTIEKQQLGMTNFTYYNNDFSVIGNPRNGIQIYYYMTGSITDGERFTDDFQGPGLPTKGYGSGPISNFVFWGDPSDNTQWSECACNNTPGDRRFIFSSGPFQLLPGAINDIIFGCVWAPPGTGGCGKANFKLIKNIDDQAQALFDDHFKTVEGPEAPRMKIVELDRRLIFYLVNDYGSNNYGENYGRSDNGPAGNYADSLQYHQTVTKAHGKPDSLYKFQGYRVFQLANSSVTSAQIFNQTTGEVDNTVAAEVFQCDIHDGVTQIVNYTKNLSVSDTTSVPQIKVIGRDSGIVHSFELTQDQFATGSDKRFVNYQNYYFVAIAYAYNNFANFDPNNATITQDVPYLGSAHAAGGTNITVIAALPNPSNYAMGTRINSDYGSGIVITRMEGQGNGGNTIQLDSASEDTALLFNKIDRAVYQAGQGPINIKIVDPTVVPAYDWVLQITGTSTGSAGIATSAGWKLTGFKSGVAMDTIYSEENISGLNEQIVEKYGLSLSVKQVVVPGAAPSNGNGYITSDVSYENPYYAWMWGVQDQAGVNMANWLRSGNATNTTLSYNGKCNFADIPIDVNLNYENMFANSSPMKSTWGPYALAAGFYYESNTSEAAIDSCGGVEVGAALQSAAQALTQFNLMSDVDLVFTSDKSKWTRCAVVEEQEDTFFSQGRASKFFLRNHAGWNGDVADDGNTPVYSESASDHGMSWFPGYAIDQTTGKRLNIVFGEDSYLSTDNGADMIWNPSSNQFSQFTGSIIYGGKHIVYVFNTAYDSDKAFVANVKLANPAGVKTTLKTAFSTAEWVGIPTLNPNIKLLPLSEGLIPTKTRLRFRVTRPYAAYTAVDTTKPVGAVSVIPGHASNPYYTFSTTDLAPTTLSDTSNRSWWLSRIFAVPNPYYGYSGYEKNRYDTKVRIINLPAQATVYIYSLDGSLIRTLSKNDPNVSYLDWDIRNSAGLPISSGMYMMDVKAVGIGETVIRWFGATRPLDVTTY